MREQHHGWTIEIAIGRFDSCCWVTAPNGDEYKLYIPKNQHTNKSLVMARAFINRQIRPDQEETT